MRVGEVGLSLGHEQVFVFFLLIVTFLLYAVHISVHLRNCALLFFDLYIVQVIHESVVCLDVCHFAG